MKYRRKYIQDDVEAVQFDPQRLPWPPYIKPWSTTLPLQFNHMGYIEAVDSRIPVSSGDWVVTEGDRYDVWTDQLFKAAFEVVV
jgi:hypothetical protein